MSNIDKGLKEEHIGDKSLSISVNISNTVLDKDIFSNVFQRDIRRVYIYRKSERIAKSALLVLPAFKDNKALKASVERVSVELIEASTRPLAELRERLLPALLSYSSALEIAKTGKILSEMNANLIQREVNAFLHEVSGLEDSRILLPDDVSFSTLSKYVSKTDAVSVKIPIRHKDSNRQNIDNGHNGGMNGKRNGRRDVVLNILKDNGPSFIKDISTHIRDVSEKTIQRELQALVSLNLVKKRGERRWTVYELVSSESVQ